MNKKYAKQFVELKQIFRESFDTDPNETNPAISDISQQVFRTIEESTYRKLSAINIYNTGTIMSKSTFNFLVNENQPNFSLAPIRKIANKNEFIKFPAGTPVSEIFSSSTKHNFSPSYQNNLSHLEAGEALQIKKPYYVMDKRALNKDYYKMEEYFNNDHKSNCQNKKTSLPDLMLLDFSSPIQNLTDFVKLHSEGYENKENVDLFQHLYRMMIKRGELFQISKNGKLRGSTLGRGTLNNIMQQNEEIIEIDYLVLKQREFVLKASIIDIHLYEELIKRYEGFKNMSNAQNKSNIGNTTDIQLHNINFDSSNQLQTRIEEKLIMEEVFITRILNKINDNGVESLTIKEMTQFKDIVQQRKDSLQQLERHILKIKSYFANKNSLDAASISYEQFFSDEPQKEEENEKPKNKYSDEVSPKNDTKSDYFSHSGAFSPSKLSNLSSSKYSYFDEVREEGSNDIDEEVKIHKMDEAKKHLPFILHRRKSENLKPMHFDPNSTPIPLFGNLDLNHLGLNIEIVKKTLIERLNLHTIQEEIQIYEQNLSSLKRNKKKLKLKGINLIVPKRPKTIKNVQQKFEFTSHSKTMPKIKKSLETKDNIRQHLKEPITKLRDNSKTLQRFSTKHGVPEKVRTSSLPTIITESNEDREKRDSLDSTSIFNAKQTTSPNFKMNKPPPLIIAKKEEKVKVETKPFLFQPKIISSSFKLSAEKDKTVKKQPAFSNQEQITLEKTKIEVQSKSSIDAGDKTDRTKKLEGSVAHILETNLKNTESKVLIVPNKETIEKKDYQVKQKLNEPQLSKPILRANSKKLKLSETKEVPKEISPSPKKYNVPVPPSIVVETKKNIIINITPTVKINLPTPSPSSKTDFVFPSTENIDEILPSLNNIEPSSTAALFPESKDNFLSIERTNKEKPSIFKNGKADKKSADQSSSQNLLKSPAAIENRKLSTFSNYGDAKPRSSQNILDKSPFVPSNERKKNRMAILQTEDDRMSKLNISEEKIVEKPKKTKTKKNKKKDKLDSSFQINENLDISINENIEKNKDSVMESSRFLRSRKDLFLDVEIKSKRSSRHFEDLDDIVGKQLAAMDKKALRQQKLLKNKQDLTIQINQVVGNVSSPISSSDLPRSPRSPASKAYNFSNELSESPSHLIRSLSKGEKKPSLMPRPSIDPEHLFPDESSPNNKAIIDNKRQSLFSMIVNDVPLKLSKIADATKNEEKNNNVPFWEEEEDGNNRKSVFGKNKYLGVEGSLKNNGGTKKNSTLLGVDDRRGSRMEKRNSAVGDYSHLMGNKDAKKGALSRKSIFVEKRDNNGSLGLNSSILTIIESPKEHSSPTDKKIDKFDRMMNSYKSPLTNSKLKEFESDSDGDADYLAKELKKLDGFNIKDLKKGIEKMTGVDVTDPESQFNLLMYNQRNDQLKKFIELSGNQNHEWLVEPDCEDQLNNFLNERNKLFHDHEKNENLKFCSSIQIQKTDALRNFGDPTKKTGESKLLNFLFEYSQDYRKERERKKKFLNEFEMIKKIKHFLNKNFSIVKQETLREKKTIEATEKSIHHSDEIENERGRQENEIHMKSKFSEHKNFSKFSNSSIRKFERISENLKILKNKNEKKYNAILKKFKLIKNKTENDS